MFSDFDKNRLYWVDGRLRLIGTSDLNGGGRKKIIYDGLIVGHTFAIAHFSVNTISYVCLEQVLDLSN